MRALTRASQCSKEMQLHAHNIQNATPVSVWVLYVVFVCRHDIQHPSSGATYITVTP